MAVFVRSPFGASLLRHARPAAAHDGARLSRLADPLLAFLFSGFWTGVAGLLFIYYNQFISPQVLALTASAEVLLMVISGGTGTLLGPIVGAAIVVIMKNVVSAYHRALEPGARRHLRRHRHLDAGGPRARLRAAVAARPGAS